MRAGVLRSSFSFSAGLSVTPILGRVSNTSSSASGLDGVVIGFGGVLGCAVPGFFIEMINY